MTKHTLPIQKSMTAAISPSKISNLVKAGVDYKLILETNIQVNTRLSRLITKFFNSAATTLLKTIYFHATYYDDATSSGLSLISHELCHVQQWKREGIFFIFRYCLEFLKFSLISLNAGIHKRQLPKYWVHDQISYEQEAISFETKTREKLKLLMH